MSGMGRPSPWRDRGKVKALPPSQGPLSPGPQVGLVLAGESQRDRKERRRALSQEPTWGKRQTQKGSDSRPIGQTGGLWRLGTGPGGVGKGRGSPPQRP